jgi:hypothetical protein
VIDQIPAQAEHDDPPDRPDATGAPGRNDGQHPDGRQHRPGAADAVALVPATVRSVVHPEPAVPGLPADLLALTRRADAEQARSRAAADRAEGRQRLAVLRVRVFRDDGLGHLTLDEVREHRRWLAGRITAEAQAGVTVHRRAPLLIRCLPPAVSLVDGLILYTFCADIFNARATDLSVPGLAAMALALLGSAIAYAWLALTGLRLRDYRTPLGEIGWQQTGLSTRLLLAGALVISGVLGLLMFERVVHQAQQALGYVTAGQVPLLGWVFGVLSVCANLTVVAAHALDGSWLAARFREVGTAVHRAERRLERARRRAVRRARRGDPAALADEPAERGRREATEPGAVGHDTRPAR